MHVACTQSFLPLPSSHFSFISATLFIFLSLPLTLERKTIRSHVYEQGHIFVSNDACSPQHQKIWVNSFLPSVFCCAKENGFSR